MPGRASHGLLAIAAALLAACDDDARKPYAPAETPAPTSAERPAPAPAPASPLPAAPAAYEHRPGPAYLGVDGVGLLRLDEGVFTRVVAHRFPFQQIVVDPAGVVYAAAIGGTWRIDGKRLERLDGTHSIGLPYAHLTLGPDAVLWASDRRSVHRWEQGAWTQEPPETFDSGLLQGLTVDLDGRPWVLTQQAIWRLDTDRWNRIDGRAVGQSEPYFGAITTAADGTVYVTTMAGTFAHRDGRWTATALSERFGGLDTLVAGPAGHVAASGGVGTLVVAAPGGPVRRTVLSDGPADARRGDVRAVDGAGRVWLTTDNGVVILDAGGDLVQQWAPGTVAGLDGKITALAVVGDGPTLPPLRAAATGTVTGRILRAGKPVARATVELCDMPLMVFERTPCDSSTRSFTGTAAADGAFRIEGVPIGTYGFAIKPDARWRVLLDGDCCSRLEPGGTFDVGAITVH